MKRTLLLFTLFLVTNLSFAQGKDEMYIRNTLNEQVAAWNDGNINRYMQTYWKSDSLIFVGKSGVTYGWQQTFANYEKAYPDTASMGMLDIGIIEIKRLSVLYFHVTGKWKLTRTKGNMEGHFTLLFKRIKNKWLIVSDHSS